MENHPENSFILGNRYQIQSTLGSGGMAVVYLARDTLLARPVAIKALREDFSSDESFRERFRQEARAAANLSHPNIVTVHDFGLDAGRLFIVMEYLPGTNLKAMIQKRGKFTVQETLALITQAAEGVGYAHRAGLVHCDVKPQNFLVSPDQHLKVTDFGIARALSTIHPDEKNDVVWGSPQYFSPEQASGLAPSPASDVYSLGVIMYEMITGRLPFISKDPNELIRLHQEVAPIPPSRFSPDIPPAVEKIILKLLSKEPASRYRTAEQLARILKSIRLEAAAKPIASENGSTLAHQSYRPAAAPFNPYPASTAPSPVNTAESEEEEEPLNIDWATIGLGLLTFTAVAGLIPFWLYIWFTLTTNRPLP